MSTKSPTDWEWDEVEENDHVADPPLSMADVHRNYAEVHDHLADRFEVLGDLDRADFHRAEARRLREGAERFERGA